PPPPPPPAAATPVRMFAVGHKVRTADATTYASFHDKMAALMDAGFPGRVTLVQAGVADVASHLFPTDPAALPNALVVLPEETGLVAALTGRPAARPRRALPHVRLPGRVALPPQHDARLRARRRGAAARRQRRDAREPVGVRRRHSGLDQHGVSHADRGAAARQPGRPLARLRPRARPGGARHARPPAP